MLNGLRVTGSCIALITAALLTSSVALPVVSQQSSTRIETDAEQCSFELEDHSVVQANNSSTLRINMSPHRRYVELLRGEARFRVAKDRMRTFVVDTPYGEIRALGTIFNVKVQDDGTAITVLEGQVEAQGHSRGLVASKDAGVVLSKNQYVVIDKQGGIALFAGTSPEQANRWPKREIQFNKQSLSAVLAVFNKYQANPIRVFDKSLAAHEISGSFNVYDTETLLAYLKQYEGVRVEHSVDGSKVLRVNKHISR
jgi:transmembrane sensor